MSTQIVINNLSGSSEFSVYIGETCEDVRASYLGLININNDTPPHIFNVPEAFLTSESYCVRLVADNGCILCECFTYN